MNHPQDLLQSLKHLNAAQLRRPLTEQLTRQKLGLYWESSAIDRDAALNANTELPRLVEDCLHNLKDVTKAGTPNLNNQSGAQADTSVWRGFVKPGSRQSRKLQANQKSPKY